MNEIIGVFLLAVGVLFDIFGCIGLVRLPDIYNRLQAATKCVTLGTCLILAGTIFLGGSAAAAWKAVLCIIFIAIASPAAAHALARGSYSFGVGMADISVADQYGPDLEDEPESSSES